MSTPSKIEMMKIAMATAVKHGLDPALVCAVCEHESGGWNPWALRFEPAFEAHYIDKLKLRPAETSQRSTSYGLMQVMGEVAREDGFTGPYLTELCDPEVGIEFGCRELAKKLAAAGGDVRKGLLGYNGGADPAYPDKVLALISKYQETTATAGEVRKGVS